MKVFFFSSSIHSIIRTIIDHFRRTHGNVTVHSGVFLFKMNPCIAIYCLVTKHEWANLLFAGHPNIGPFCSKTTVEYYLGTYLYCNNCGRTRTHTRTYNIIFYVCTVQRIWIVGERIIVINHFSTVGMTVQSDWYNTDGVLCILYYWRATYTRREVYHIGTCYSSASFCIFIPV